MLVSFLGYKGGVGKTTSCVNTAGFLKMGGKRILVIDLDPQANATSALGIDPRYVDLNTHAPRESIIESVEGIHLLSLGGMENFGEIVSALRDLYDFVLIDAPPSSKDASIACYNMSDLSFACFDCGILALESFRHLGIKTESAIVCKYRSFRDRSIRKDIEGMFTKTFVVPYDQRVIDSQISGKTLATSYPRSRSAHSYIEITRWILSL